MVSLWQKLNKSSGIRDYPRQTIGDTIFGKARPATAQVLFAAQKVLLYITYGIASPRLFGRTAKLNPL
jgi:hypothetical protein